MSNKHDGLLDTYHEAKIFIENDHFVLWQEYGSETRVIKLLPMQTLKLLAWLEEEYPTLWRMIRERDDVMKQAQGVKHERA